VPTCQITKRRRFVEDIGIEAKQLLVCFFAALSAIEHVNPRIAGLPAQIHLQPVRIRHHVFPPGGRRRSHCDNPGRTVPKRRGQARKRIFEADDFVREIGKSEIINHLKHPLAGIISH
jgi:hypothetical protein